MRCIYSHHKSLGVNSAYSLHIIKSMVSIKQFLVPLLLLSPPPPAHTHRPRRGILGAVPFCPSAPGRKELHRRGVERPTTGDARPYPFHGRHAAGAPHHSPTRPSFPPLLYPSSQVPRPRLHAPLTLSRSLARSPLFSPPARPQPPSPSPPHSFTYIIVSPLSLQQPSAFWQGDAFVYSPRASADSPPSDPLPRAAVGY